LRKGRDESTALPLMAFDKERLYNDERERDTERRERERQRGERGERERRRWRNRDRERRKSRRRERDRERRGSVMRRVSVASVQHNTRMTKTIDCSPLLRPAWDSLAT
jgi:hypothetical protein